MEICDFNSNSVHHVHRKGALLEEKTYFVSVT